MPAKNSFKNFKPYEIRIENRAPDIALNPNDAPVGAPGLGARIQRKKYKQWIHLNPSTGEVIAVYFRKGRENARVKHETCPKEIVEYAQHYFIGKSVITDTVGWNYQNPSLFAFPDGYIIEINDSNGVPYQNGALVSGLGGLKSFFEETLGIYKTNVNTNQTAEFNVVETANGLYVEVIGGVVADNMQISLWRDNGTNPDIYFDGSPDPDGDDINGIKPYTFQIEDTTAGKCELIKINDGVFDCTTDEVFFTKPSETIILNGSYVGWSFPESVQRSNVPTRDNRSWTVFFDNLNTDGIGTISTTPTTQAFTSFYSLVSELNSQLTTYGSSFRLVAVGNDRLLVSDINYNVLLETDPQFVNLETMNLVIQDSTTNSDWLINSTNPKKVTLSNISYQTGIGGMYKGTIGCSVQSVTGDFVDNTDPLNPVISIPDATVSQRGLVSTGTQTFGGNKTFQKGVFVQGQTQFGFSPAGNNTLVGRNQIISQLRLPQLLATISDKPTGGTIGTAATTVDNQIYMRINQTTAGQILTIPAPTDTDNGKVIIISNSGTASFVVDGTVVAPGKSLWMIRDGTQWAEDRSIELPKSTTSIVAKHGDGTTHVNSQSNSASTVADVLELSDGTLVNNEDTITRTGHGLGIHKWYFLSPTVSGGYTDIQPTYPNYSQRLFYTQDANTIKVNIQEANIGGSALATSKYIGPTTANPSIILGNFEIQFETATTNIRIRTLTGTETIMFYSSSEFSTGNNQANTLATSLSVNTTYQTFGDPGALFVGEYRVYTITPTNTADQRRYEFKYMGIDNGVSDKILMSIEQK